MITVAFAELQDFIDELDARQMNPPIVRVAAGQIPEAQQWLLRATAIMIMPSGEAQLYSYSGVVAGEATAEQEVETLRAELEGTEAEGDTPAKEGNGIDVAEGSRFEASA